MSRFLSRVDKTVSRTFMEIDINHETSLPEKFRMVVLTGVKGTGGDKNGKGRLDNEEHVAFHFEYTIGDIDEVAAFKVPPAARKLLQ